MKTIFNVTMWGGAVLAIAFAANHAASNRNSSSEFEAELRAARALGMPVVPADFHLPEVNPAENAAPRLKEVAVAIRATPEWRRVVLGTKEEFLAFHQSNPNFAQEAMEAAEMPECDFGMSWLGWTSASVPGYDEGRLVARYLLQAAEAEASFGHDETAVRYLSCAERIGMHLGNQPLLLSVSAQAVVDRKATETARRLLTEYPDRPVLVAGIRQFAAQRSMSPQPMRAIAFEAVRVLAASAGAEGSDAQSRWLAQEELHRLPVEAQRRLTTQLRNWRVQIEDGQATAMAAVMDTPSPERVTWGPSVWNQVALLEADRERLMIESAVTDFHTQNGRWPATLEEAGFTATPRRVVPRATDEGWTVEVLASSSVITS